MLTVTPLLWAYVTYLVLKTYPKEELLKGPIITALIFLLLAIIIIIIIIIIIMDYIFFGHIRNVMEKLYHPTTFYGYGF